MSKKTLLAVGGIIIVLGLLFLLVINPFSSGEVTVHISKSGFSPQEVTPKKGQTVRWVNDDQTLHWPASNPHPTHELYLGFDPGEPISPGGEWSFKFNNLGEWRYHDHLQPDKFGLVKVTH
ncbi:MAG TPA: hypothetical protein VIH52_02400 [Candidatus Nanoarchaeia archaeon]